MSDTSPVMIDTLLIREWDSDTFHQRVLEMEARGYEARRETYHIFPEMNPETGEIIHLHSIEMCQGSVGRDTESPLHLSGAGDGHHNVE